jgi:hypothetical protein
VSDSVDDLVLDLLEWLSSDARPYDEVLDAWRTSCPRLPVWEEANARGLLEWRRAPEGTPMVAIAPTGVALLSERRPATALTSQ